MRLLIFVLLKIVEVSAVVFGPYYLGRFVHLWTGFFCMHEAKEPSCAPMWFIGVIAMVVLGGIACLVKANWELAKELQNRLKG